MQAAGVIIEYNPMHMGHVHLLQEIRRQLGADTPVVCAMSGNFVQRGDFAIVGRRARACAAVQSGADLVLEVPLPWAVASAERFADGGVQVLLGTGLVTDLAFGSECGDAAALWRAAAALLSPDMDSLVRRELIKGDSFAAARQRAVSALLPAEDAALLGEPNNTLGIEYCKALLRRGSSVRPMTVKRKGMHHSGQGPQEGYASATRIREALRRGDWDWALAEMAPAMKAVYEAEEAAGRAPVFLENCQRAVLAKLRTMTEAEFAPLDEGREGLYHRLYEASRTACSVEALCQAAKTKRYAYSRISRMLLWAYLGLVPADFPEQVPYLRVLAANGIGRALLARMRETASLPVLTKPADVRLLPEPAQRLFALEAQATDLYTLAYPNLTAAHGGTEWREGPVIL